MFLILKPQKAAMNVCNAAKYKIWYEASREKHFFNWNYTSFLDEQ